MSNENYTKGLVDGLAPALGLPKIGEVYRDTTLALAAKLTEEISGKFDLPELDNIIFVPKIAKNNVGASEIVATAYFLTQNSNGNIFYRGKGNNNRVEGGRINMVAAAGNAAGGSGPFGTSDHFRSIMKPFCKVDDKGRPILNLKVVPGFNNIASLDLDANLLLCLVLGIAPNDPYDFDIMSIQPTQGTGSNNFVIALMKYIVTDGVRKGRNSQINYARIGQDQFNRYNNGKNNNQGRTF